MEWYWILASVAVVWLASCIVVAVFMCGLLRRIRRAERALVVTPPVARPKAYQERLKAEYAKRGIVWVEPTVTNG